MCMIKIFLRFEELLNLINNVFVFFFFYKVLLTVSEWQNIIYNFELWNFPTYIGAINEKHVVIQSYVNIGSQY